MTMGTLKKVEEDKIVIPTYKESELPPTDDIGQIIYVEKENKFYMAVTDGNIWKISKNPTSNR